MTDYTTRVDGDVVQRYTDPDDTGHYCEVPASPTKTETAEMTKGR